MKTLLLSFFLLTAMHSTVSAQTTASSNKAVVNDTNKEDTKYTFQYLVGTDKVYGYEMKVCKYYPSSVEPLKSFKNGKSAPILQVYVMNKSAYIGGVLENEKGKTTIIKDITLAEKDSTLVFKVVGKDFSMSFNLNTGTILKEEETVTVFHTDKIGAWKINKKK